MLILYLCNLEVTVLRVSGIRDFSSLSLQYLCNFGNKKWEKELISKEGEKMQKRWQQQQQQQEKQSDRHGRWRKKIFFLGINIR